MHADRRLYAEKNTEILRAMFRGLANVIKRGCKGGPLLTFGDFKVNLQLIEPATYVVGS
jgi:hypothetical protein